MRVRPLGYLLTCAAVAALTSVLPAVRAVAQTSAQASPASTQASPPGATLWSQQFANQYGASPTSVAANPRAPIVYVTGWTDTGQHEKGYPNIPVDDVTTVAYNSSTGAQVWVAHYQGNGFMAANYPMAPLIAVSSNGSQVFVGADACEQPWACTAGGGTYGQAVLGYNATTGDSTWATFNSHGVPPVAMAVSPNGSYLVLTGSSRGEGYVTSSFSTVTGAMDWTVSSLLPPRNYHSEPPVGIVVSPGSSTVFVTGTQGTVALSMDEGQMLWKRYAPGAVGTSLAVSQDGSVLVVVGCQPPVRQERCSSTQLTAYNAATGAYRWSINDDATSVIANPGGPQMFVATGAPGHTEITAYDIAMGTRTQLWRTPSAGGQLALNRKGTTVFAGLGTGTVAGYDAATGAVTASVTYTFAGTERAMAISTNGSKLFVTGTGSSPGYLTTAYRL